ncbi:hypothetical protein [Limnohabitans sp. Jir72]|uniref:hypothetical protein n=1 Tax=Limnohabitans sp. Jir72 TaxID=1977909 RepID=UPI0011B26FBF|nr:hypothetical protein [Limnohabitans sp. Jir72]
MFIFRKNISLFIFLISFLCAKTYAGSYYAMKEDFTPKIETKYPQLDNEIDADVGDTILSTLYSEVRPSLVLKESIINFPLKILWQTINISIAKGQLPLYKSTDDGKFYEGLESVVQGLGKKSGPPAKGVVFVPADKNKPVQVCYLERENSHINCNPSEDLKENLSFTYSTVAIDQKDSFKRELIFTGVSQKTIMFIYKEFVDNLARPAFTTELKYDISDDGMIGYKGARFMVIKAGNTGVRYKVLKGLN